MSVTLAQLQRWLTDDEGERLEFKKAENNYPKDKLVNYCVALVNERGGRFILGVTDQKPRQIVGTQAFLNLAQFKHELLDRLRLRIEIDEINYPNARVLVFTVPSRPLGVPMRFLEKIGKEKTSVFTTQDWLVLDLINREQKIPDSLKTHLPLLLEQGVIERAGGRRLLLARQFYDFVDKKGVYTRKHGLDRETNKALLMKHIVDNQDEGSQLKDLIEVLPAFSEDQVKKLLQELKNENRTFLTGKTRGTRWYPNSDSIEKLTGD